MPPLRIGQPLPVASTTSLYPNLTPPAFSNTIFTLSPSSTSDPRVVRQRRSRRRRLHPFIPTTAQRGSFLDDRAPRWPHTCSIRLALEDLQGKTLRGVLSNVAMQEPRSGIVSLESDDDKAVGGHQHHVSPWRIESVQADVGGGVHGIFGLLEDGKVVPVEVDLGSMLEKGTVERPRLGS